MPPLDRHRKAVTVAVFVTFLWSSSWILIKWGLDALPPLTFAGLRYFLGFLCLLPFALRYQRAAPREPLTRREWWNYSVTACCSMRLPRAHSSWPWCTCRLQA